MIRPYITFILVFICRQLFSQNTAFDITVHSHVDTSKQEIKEIVSLWVNYLSSKPDSIYNNPYWNEAEKKKYRDFDFTRLLIYQLPSAQLLSYYKPTILSVEKEGDNYAIRTLFNADGLDGVYRKSNPWCITKLYAVKENNEWKLKNALPILTQSWKRETIGKITFVYPPEHLFNETLATRANAFCDSLSQKFQFPDWKPFDFYITKSGDELGKLLGFDFYFAGYSTGMGMKERGALFCANDSEWYPHEFVHLIDGDNKRHPFVEEGFATWVSGQLSFETSFETGARKLAQALSKTDTVTFEDIVHRKWGWQNASLNYYSTGAIVCKLIYAKGGLAAIKKLLNTPPNDAALTKTICELLKIKPTEFDKYLRSEILKYLKPK